MMELLPVLLGQSLLLHADLTARKHASLGLLTHWRFWSGRYLPSRLGGLLLRLFALVHLPAGAAATLFAASAVSFASVAAALHREGMVRREWAAVGLIVVAVAIRGMR